MINITRIYYSTFGLFFQGARLYRIDLEKFKSSVRYESFGSFVFYLPNQNDIKLFEKLYENLPGKIDSVQKIFDSGNYKCFSYLDKKNQRLAYTRWLCINEYYSEAMKKKFDFKPDEAITLDSYTHPDYRLSGLHKKMNIEMLNWLKAKSEIKQLYMVILMFIPYLRTLPLKLGYRPIETVFYYRKGSFHTVVNLLKKRIGV